jgi:anti-sigma28 factor (negative regulator of flagellin synthesis)
VRFEDIGVTYRDDVAGNNVKFYLGKLETKIKDFDLANQHYVIKNFSVNNTSLLYLQQKPLTELAQHLTNTVDSAKKETGKLPTIEVEKFEFNNVKVNYDDQLTTTNAIADVNKLAFDNLKVDLTNGSYTTDNAELANSLIKFAFKPAPSNDLDQVKDTVVAEQSSLALLIKKINLNNNLLQFDNLGVRPLKKGIDFNHLNIVGLNLGAEDVSYSAKGITAKVKNGSLKDKSGFELNTLRGDAVYNDKQIKLSDFVLKTPHTQIENNTDITFTSLDDLTKNPERVKLDLALKNTTIGLKDATFFTDALPAQYNNLKIKVDAKVDGSLNALNIPKMQVSGLRNTKIDISGKANNVTDVNKAYLDLNIKKIHLTKGDILAVVPKKSLPASIELPNVIDANGKFKGSMTNFGTNFNIRSDMGAAVLAANMKGTKGRENYKANINLVNFNVGRLLKQQPTLGRVSAKAAVTGTGLDAKKINAKFNATVLSAYYNTYTYRNLTLSGGYANEQLAVKGNMPDSNLNFNLTANANLAGKYPAVKANVALKHVDLQKLNFSTSVFRLAGNIKADIKTADVDYLNGDVFATGLQLVKDGKKFNVDTIEVNAVSTADSNKIALRSELLSANVEGKYQLSKVGAAIINQINKYYQFGEVTNIAPQRIRFNANIYNPKFLQDFVPELTAFSPARMNGLIDTEKDSLVLNAVFPKITYSGINLDSVKLNVNNEPEKLNYKLFVNSIQNTSIALFSTEISGAAADNKLDLNIFFTRQTAQGQIRNCGYFPIYQ